MISAQSTASTAPPASELACSSPIGDTVFLNARYFSFVTGKLEQVIITGSAIRNDNTVCVGESCQVVLTGLRDAGERAAAILGGWKEEITQALFPKLPQCTKVAPGNAITVDQDAAWDYAAAVDAVKSVYGGSLTTISRGNRVDVRYNSGGTFTFWIADVNAAAGSVQLADPTPAQAGGPCQ